MTKSDLKKITDYIWEVPVGFRPGMKVPARVFSTEKMLDSILQDQSLDQLTNMTLMPGILKFALAMPDVHEGYGFPVGGVAAFDAHNEGVISPGGIGYDINCGVRLMKSSLTFDEVKEKLEELGYALYREVPSGVGRGGRLKLSEAELDKILENGAKQIVKMGYGNADNLPNIESEGCLENANPAFVSPRAKKRGLDQVGTLGAGNHFVEVDIVDEIYDEEMAKKYGLFDKQAVVLIHTGSRGLGHQIATDYIKEMVGAMQKYGIQLPDRELACAPFDSEEGQKYFSAMACGANFAWANREMIAWETNNAFIDMFGKKGELELLYDVAHNIAKVENYDIDGKEVECVVHRKGATRSFPDQPVLIPGSMGTYSYVLSGMESSFDQSFGSCCHGAGRRMSRTKARKEVDIAQLQKSLEDKGVAVNVGSLRGLAEEAPAAYKDVNEVVEVVHNVGIAKKVARVRPVVVVKG